jgi:DNA-binding beta-propeller fold protein YncE
MRNPARPRTPVALAVAVLAVMTAACDGGSPTPAGATASAIASPQPTQTATPGASPAGETPLPNDPSSAASVTFDAGQNPCGVTTDGELVWVTNLRSNEIIAIDPVENLIVRRERLGSSPCGLAYLDGSLWHEERVRFLVRRDAVTLEQQDELLLNGTVSDVRATDDAVWLVVREPGRVARVDPATNEIVASINIGAPARGMAVGAGSVWVAAEGTDEVVRIDAATNEILATIRVGDAPVWLAASDAAVWVSTINDGMVHHIDVATNRVVRSVRVGAMPLDPEIAGGFVWVPNSGDDTITKIDPADGRVVATLDIGPSPAVVRHLFGDLWVTGLIADGRVWRLPLDAGE